MSKRAHSLTVVLAEETPPEHLESLMLAIRHFRSVIAVSANVGDSSHFAATYRVQHDLRDSVLKVLGAAVKDIENAIEAGTRK